MPINDLSAGHLAAASGNWEPQRVNQGQLRIFGLGDNGILELAVRQFDLPKGTNNPLELPFLNQKRKVAGRFNVEDLNIQVQDYVDRNIAQVLWKWRQEVNDFTTGRIGYAANYKKSGAILLTGPTGAHDRWYELEGMWPTNFDHGQIDLAGDDLLLISMTLALDHFRPGTGMSEIEYDAENISQTPPGA